jgi:putative membrane protein
MLKKESILILILIVFYSVGIVGTHIPEYKQSFLGLSYFNLLLSFSILLLARKENPSRFIQFLLFAFTIGMVVELIGVHTGYLFGDYHYDNNLGLKIYEVPLVIGLNWGLLTSVSASLIHRFFTNEIVKILTGALIMTFFDVLMEPVAVKSGFWTWNKGEIPLYNYVCWFLVSILLQGVFIKLKLSETNKVNNVLFISMFVFFITLIAI